MSAFLSDEWLGDVREAMSELPEIEGANGAVQYVVSGAPGGRVQIRVDVESGRLAGIEAGKHPDPQCTVTLTYEDAVALVTGDLRPEVAFMSGRAKVEGDHRVWLLDLRPVRRSAEMTVALETVRKSTET